MADADPARQFTDMEWIQFLGIEPLTAEHGIAEIRLVPRGVHLNHNGTVNAPVLFALAEVAAAGALVAEILEEATTSYTVVRSASIDYLGPARGPVTATAAIPPDALAALVAEVRSQRPIEVVIPVSITDDERQQVCTADISVAVRPRRQSTPL